MAFTSATTDTNHPTQASVNNQPTTATDAALPNHNTTAQTNSALGLLHDDQHGNHPVESKDITILRRLKLAILEGQHPYFKANVDLSNLQDLFLASGSRTMGPGAHQPSVLDPPLARSSGHTRRNAPPALDDLGSSGPATLDYGNEDGNEALKTGPVKESQPVSISGHLEDVNMAAPDNSEQFERPDESSQDDTTGDHGSDGRRPSAQTLGRHVLHSPVQSESDSQVIHKRKASDAPTLVDLSDQNVESEVHVKRESPPYQLSGTQPQTLEPSSSSMASFVSNSTASTGLTSDDAGANENLPGVDTDLTGYNPKYGNKADYLRRQKVRSKAIESIDEKRRAGHRPDGKPGKPGQKSPVHPMDSGIRRGSGPNVSPVRGRDPPLRTHSLTSVADGPGSGLRHTPPLDGPPPPNFPASPLGRLPAPSFRPISPPTGKYPPPRRPRDPSPTRDYRPQYLPYDDPRSARPRPIVSSPPRGSPPRESPAPRTALDRQVLDNYSNPYPRTETRSFDLRPASPIFSDAPRTTVSYSMDSDSNWSSRGLPPRAPPPPPPSRNSPPTRDMIHDRTPFASTTLPANPNTGYRPQGLPDPPNTRYSPYDPPTRRVDWAARDWDSTNRSTDSKPKLQDRFNMDTAWPRDTLESRPHDDYTSRPLRDEFTPLANDDYASRYRREPSPTASRYADGFRSGFNRPLEVEGIRPMKRSRPDDGYIRSGPGLERSRYELDGRPPVSDYYRREPPRRDDEYEPRSRPPY